jgi:hypothetical protein
LRSQFREHAVADVAASEPEMRRRLDAALRPDRPLVDAAPAPRIVFRPGPIVVHASPVFVHISPVVYTSDTTPAVIAELGVLWALAALGWQAWTFQRFAAASA